MSNRYVEKYIKTIYYNYLKNYRAVRSIVKLLRYDVLRIIHSVRIFRGKKAKKYICTLPWDSAAIKAHGGVTCSTASRGRDELFYGSINESPFIDVWHGERLQALRKRIKDPCKELPYLCYTCPYKVDNRDISALKNRPDYPKYLWVESTDRCNLKCPVCVHSDDRGGHLLSFERYKGMIDEVGPYLQKLFFFLDGENYLHPKATDMTRYAKSVNNKIRIYTSTNGLLFDSSTKQEDFVRSCVDEATFSIDGAYQDSYAHYRKGGSLDLVLRNLQGIIDIRNRLEVPLHITWRYILFEWNDSEEEMDRARELAGRIGVDSLSWLITTTVFHSKRFLLPNINDYSVKLPYEHYEASYMGEKEIILKQKLV
jgi:MoaA/NifB/PqqE/SkfB family radical SAM enzyme